MDCKEKKEESIQNQNKEFLMFISWSIILLIYGFLNNLSNIPTLCWWLLLPCFLQDFYDYIVRNKII